MEKQELREWTNHEAGVEIKAVLVKDAPYEVIAGSGMEVADLWILFLSIIGNDFWMAYGIVDTLDDQPHNSLETVNLTKLKKMSIVIGDRWKKISEEPMQTSKHHRQLATDAQVVNDIIMEMNFTELQERRMLIDWENVKLHWEKFPMVLSLN